MAKLYFQKCIKKINLHTFTTAPLAFVVPGEWAHRLSLWMETQAIGSVHPSESGTIAVFQGEKGESQLDEKGECL